MDEAQQEFWLKASLTIKEVTEFLNKHRFPFCVIGGGSLGFFGLGRFTKDLDFKVKITEDQWTQLKEELEKAPWITNLRIQFCSEPKIPDLIQFHWNNYAVDLLVANVEYQEQVIQRAQQHPLYELEVPVVAPEDLIILKLIANRPQDRVDIGLLLKKFAHLDMAYIRSWCQVWEVEELLDDFLT